MIPRGLPTAVVVAAPVGVVAVERSGVEGRGVVRRGRITVGDVFHFPMGSVCVLG